MICTCLVASYRSGDPRCCLRFISDCVGVAPLISDDQHTCRMPADVDEDAFIPKSVVLPQPAEQLGASNFSYFVQKCK